MSQNYRFDFLATIKHNSDRLVGNVGSCEERATCWDPVAMERV
jgi:hypothetical protein